MIINLKKSITVFTLVLIICSLFFTADVHGESAYTTDRYDVHIDVKKDNSMMITETITVNFSTPRHGIYRWIPLRGEAHSKVKGKPVTTEGAFKIDQVKVKGYEYETGVQGKDFMIQIGSPDHTVTGKKTYRISYRYRAYEDGVSDYDFFANNVLSHKWDTLIKKASITINMPEKFNEKKLDVYVGTYGDNQYTDLVETKVKGKQIRIKSKGALPQGTGITVLQMLPEGYFKGAMSTTWAYHAALAAALAAAVLTLLMWACFGRDRKMIKPVEFYPPEDITSAELGYVIDGKVHKQDIISMLIYFADKGYLKVVEKEKNDITLIKEKSLPQEAPAFQHTIMNGVFQSGNTEVSLKDMPSDFYVAFSTASFQIKQEYTKKKEKRLYHRAGNVARIIGALLMTVPMGAGIVLGSIYAKVQYGFFIALPVCAILFLAFFCGLILYDRKGGMKQGKYRFLNLLLLLAALGVLVLGTIVIDQYMDYITAIVAAVCSVAAYIFTRQMRKLTSYGNQLIGRILGFKEFLIVAELDKLNELVEEDPSYFYSVLPYVYVFGLSDKWARKFDSIPVDPPQWYSGSYSDKMFNSWIFINSFHHCTRSMQDNISVVNPTASSSGSSGSSGSFGSFGGGGGFSGGGFGGGGGGAW